MALSFIKYNHSFERVILADIAYFRNDLPSRVKSSIGWLLQTVLRPAKVKGFVVLPKRWIVERTFGWLARYRRHSKDYERSTASSEAMIYISMSIRVHQRLLAALLRHAGPRADLIRWQEVPLGARRLPDPAGRPRGVARGRGRPSTGCTTSRWSATWGPGPSRRRSTRRSTRPRRRGPSLPRPRRAPEAKHATRISVLLANRACDQTLTVTPILWAMLGVLPLDEIQVPHRHQSVALDLIIDCKPGCFTLVDKELDDSSRIIDLQRVDWKPASAFVTPPVSGTPTTTSRAPGVPAADPGSGAADLPADAGYPVRRPGLSGLDGLCPHQGGHLAEPGRAEAVVTCPRGRLPEVALFDRAPGDCLPHGRNPPAVLPGANRGRLAFGACHFGSR